MQAKMFYFKLFLEVSDDVHKDKDALSPPLTLVLSAIP